VPVVLGAKPSILPGRADPSNIPRTRWSNGRCFSKPPRVGWRRRRTFAGCTATFRSTLLAMGMLMSMSGQVGSKSSSFRNRRITVCPVRFVTYVSGRSDVSEWGCYMLGRRTPYRSIVFCQIDRLQPWMSGGWEGGDLRPASSDKSEKLLRFNSALRYLLSECALKVFSRRNPSKLDTRGASTSYATTLGDFARLITAVMGTL
jgi:hypothetical protein